MKFNLSLHRQQMTNWLACVVLVLLSLSMANAHAGPVDFSAGPQELVTQVSNALFEDINQNRAAYRENPEGLDNLIREVFIPLLDRRFSAQLILGKHGRGLDAEKIDAFGEALMNQLVGRYSEGLLEFDSRDQVKVLPLAGKNTDRQTKVRTRIQLNNGEQAPVDYVLRKTDDGWKSFDVIIEGISYVATYRNQFGEEIKRDGFDKVLKRLQAGDIVLDTGQE